MREEKRMQRLTAHLLICTVLIFGEYTAFADNTDIAELKRDFINPPLRYKSRPLWFWNGLLTTSEINTQMENSKKSGYYGFGILPSPGMVPSYLSEDYFSRYGDALNKAKELGLKMCLYDEYWFPSGNVGSTFGSVYPQDTAKRLDMLVEDVNGPVVYEKTILPGTLMGVVAMDNTTKARVDITSNINDGKLIWKVPSGSWKIMIFTCVKDKWEYVDYLNPASVAKFIKLTHERYYKKFSEHFGTTIDTAFYDEPTFYHIPNGRMWTDRFNTAFQREYGFSPVQFYPALWYDIGCDTAAARNALFGFRAQLYATGFPKVINDWCSKHGIQSTGHVDQEEAINPVGLSGDLIKAFQYQQIPGIDSIFKYGRGSRMYKVVSSSAYNYDKSLVMTEIYGAMGEDIGVNTLYKEAMDEFAKGINYFVPHAIWYDNSSVKAPPELSYRSPTYGPVLSAYNNYIGRVQKLLQGGRHVADIAILYPIATLQAGYYFGVGEPHQGRPVPQEADYMDVGELLSLNLRRDFTYVHPEVLDNRCTVGSSVIKLNNTKNYEQYKVFIIPGSKVIKWSNLQKIQQFYESGGKVIATTHLPYKSAEFGMDEHVTSTLKSIFGFEPTDKLHYKAKSYTSNCDASGGKAYFAQNPSADIVKSMLDDAIANYDVEFESDLCTSEGNLSYIHKIKGNIGIYFFANSSDSDIDTYVRLRGGFSLQVWDPHTGTIGVPEYSHITENCQVISRMRLVLPSVKSLVVIAKKLDADI